MLSGYSILIEELEVMLLSDLFNKDVILDEEAFSNAAKRLKKLSESVQNFKKDVNKHLSDLEQGFDTPAGKKFIASCKSSLISPLNDQALVIESVADNLLLAKNSYQSVFNEYQALNNQIANFKK